MRGERERAEAHPRQAASGRTGPVRAAPTPAKPWASCSLWGKRRAPDAARLAPRNAHAPSSRAGIPTAGRCEAHADDRTKALEPSSTPAGGPPSRPGSTAHPLQPMPPRAPETHARRRGRLRPPPPALLQHPPRKGMLHERTRRAEGGWKRHSNIDTSKRNLEMPFAFKVSMIH